ncbi:murein hydrolase activator EnvC family protein [Methylobacterium brachythecii]|uniref:Membrane protein n=1 Tax=Methylobacterium brachythecii TaxID=1176177 RepID=A0A7W6F685_9HYPH|nr:peptidoglycan DD-metalloendopeptidase family protein [Methylobacterium brachythecii]MBB3902104.1 septal ring factor EnvC (AmiA/AmiB activator) [Methylobacterium brachythecii]GLS44501.1 membrane protein [Methylobacterium brachythecii]
MRLTGTTTRQARKIAGLVTAAFLGLAAPSLAQEAKDPDAIQRTIEEKARRAESLKQIQDALNASAANRGSLESEIAAIGNDRAKLNLALLDAGRQAQATEDRLSRLEERLKNLNNSEGAIRKSLDARRSVIAEILAALQRMGRRPPPAVLVRPEDVLAVIRTSMLLGAVVPELRGEAETLAADLTELVRVRGQIASDRESLKTDLAGWAKERQRLDLLVEARRKRMAEVEGNLTAERQRTAELGSQAKSLKDLIERMEGEVSSARRAADEAKAAQDREAKATQERFAAAGFRDPARLAPKVKFADLRGDVPRPVSGNLTRGFNQPDGNGGTMRGVSFTTRPKAGVSSPADGWVSFAGPFRSYGRLLIINAGDGYYLLLAGMDRIDVEVGQFVLAGEPVGAMGEGGTGGSAVNTSQTASSKDDDRGDPVLYVEFRKDGGSIDPEPWWAKSPSEKVRG